jgi:hypothetical protein
MIMNNGVGVSITTDAIISALPSDCNAMIGLMALLTPIIDNDAIIVIMRITRLGNATTVKAKFCVDPMPVEILKYLGFVRPTNTLKPVVKRPVDSGTRIMSIINTYGNET